MSSSVQPEAAPRTLSSQSVENSPRSRRNLLKSAGSFTAAATAAFLFGDARLAFGQSTGANLDTAIQIFTAALIAEDLATTFYYNGLVGGVIQDSSLAGPGGTATSGTGNVPNVDYLRAALGQEIAHADLLRAVGALGSSAATDPYLTFYFPAGTFNTITPFLNTLTILENAFIGAYLNAIREFSNLAIRATIRNVPTGPYGGPFSGAQLNYFAEVAASILGIECEHRVLAGVITNANQPNNLNFESTDSLTSVYNGSNSAVAALTSFLTPSTGPAYSLSTAISGAATVSLTSSGTIPPQ
jgi:hypothetical protein